MSWIRGNERPFSTSGCQVLALNASCHNHGVVLTYDPIAAATDKAEAELSEVRALLDRSIGSLPTGASALRVKPAALTVGQRRRIMEISTDHGRPPCR